MENNKKSTSALGVILLVIGGCYVYMMNCGIRNNFGIMLQSIVENAGLTFASVSFVLAVGQMLYGVTQPVFGIIADKRGNRFSLLLGIVLSTIGIILIPFCKSVLTLMIVLGILLPGGIGAISFGVLMSEITPRIPEKVRSTVSGIINASSGIGNTLLTPVISTTIAAGGLIYGMSVLGVLAALMFPVTIFICRGSGKKEKALPEAPKAKVSTMELLKVGFKNRDYIFIVLGFFTCGFHMALITNHLPTQIMSYGYSNAETSTAFSIYGVATMIGALISGMLCSKIKMKNVLGTLYGSRTVMIVAFFLLPKTMPVICLYIVLLGLTGSATVSPVSGICGKLFGPRGMAILFSIAFLAHQFGSFLSAWLGGVCFDAMGSYTIIWFVDAAFCIFAAVISYLIKEKPVAE